MNKDETGSSLWARTTEINYFNFIHWRFNALSVSLWHFSCLACHNLKRPLKNRDMDLHCRDIKLLNCQSTYKCINILFVMSFIRTSTSIMSQFRGFLFSCRSHHLSNTVLLLQQCNYCLYAGTSHVFHCLVSRSSAAILRLMEQLNHRFYWDLCVPFLLLLWATQAKCHIVEPFHQPVWIVLVLKRFSLWFFSRFVPICNN